MNAFREVLICLLNPKLVSLLFIAYSVNLTNFYRKLLSLSCRPLSEKHR